MANKLISSALSIALGMGLYTAIPSFTDMGAAYASVTQDKNGKRKPKGKAKRIKVLSAKTAKKITKINEYYEAKDFVSAMNDLMDLKKLEDSGKLSGIDAATMWQYIGIIRYEQEDVNGTITAYRNFLNYESEVNDALVMQMTYGLGQLYFSRAMDKEGAAQKADLKISLDLLNKWEAKSTVISVSQYYFFSQVYYVLEDYQNTLKYINTVISEANLANLEIKESWYRTKLSAFYELENFQEVKNTLITLIVNWPKPMYWWQLSSTENELGNEASFYALTEAIYNQGYFDKPNHYTMLAQIFMAQEVPIKATWIMNEALDGKILESDEKSLKLLGQAYLVSQEYEKAVEPLSRVAELTEDYQLWMQVGQVQQSLDNMKGAEIAFTNSLKVIPQNQNKDKFSLNIMKGNVQTELRNYSDAKKTFDEADKVAKRGTTSQKKQMKQWRTYWTNEKKRWELMQP